MRASLDVAARGNVLSIAWTRGLSARRTSLKRSGVKQPQENRQDKSRDQGPSRAQDPTEDARRNNAVLLAQGVGNNAAIELTSVKLVLPFLYTTVGAPVFFAGLLVPLETVAKRLAQVVAAPRIGAMRATKPAIALAALVMAAAIVLISLTYNAAGPAAVVPIFLGVAAAMGAAAGLGGLAFQDLIGRVLSPARRHRLLFVQSALAGLFVVIVAYGSQYLFRPGTSLAAHQELIWLGIFLFVLAAVLTMFVREPPKHASESLRPGDEHGSLASLQKSFGIAFALPWFKRFLMARGLYLSIELAIPFFSIHAATYHGDSISGLNAFVVASSLGVMAGGFLWSRIGSVALIMVLASGLAALAGIVALGIELGLMPPTIFCYTLVFASIALAAQGVKNGRTLYLIGKTTEDERPFCIAVANVTTGAVAIVVGAGLGALAGLQGVAWPIAVLIVLNLAAAAYTFRLPKPDA